MISLWRRGYGRESSWDVHGAPSGDYRITVFGSRGDSPKRLASHDESWMRGAIQDIVFLATPYTLFALDPWVVQELLDLHEAVCPGARHPSGRELLRERDHGPYLRAIGEDLERAVHHGLLRIEALEQPRPLIEREEEEEKRPEQATDTTEDVKIKFFDLLNRPILNAPYEVSAPGFSKRGTAEDGTVTLHNVGSATRCRVRWARPPEKRRAKKDDEPLSEFEFELELFLDAGAMGNREDTARCRLSNLGHHAEDLDTALKGFQVSCGLEPTGALHDVEGELGQRHDGCNPGREKLPRKRSTA